MWFANNLLINISLVALNRLNNLKSNQNKLKVVEIFFLWTLVLCKIYSHFGATFEINQDTCIVIVCLVKYSSNWGNNILVHNSLGSLHQKTNETVQVRPNLYSLSLTYLVLLKIICKIYWKMRFCKWWPRIEQYCKHCSIQ